MDCSTYGYYTYSGLNDGGLNAQDDGREILCCVYSNDENQDYLRTTVVLKAVEKGNTLQQAEEAIERLHHAGIDYNENANLITKLNPGVYFNSLKTGDIVVLPKKA